MDRGNWQARVHGVAKSQTTSTDISNCTANIKLVAQNQACWKYLLTSQKLAKSATRTFPSKDIIVKNLPAHKKFLSQKNVPDSSYTLTATDLQSSISPRIFDSFQWRTVLRNQDPEASELYRMYLGELNWERLLCVYMYVYIYAMKHMYHLPICMYTF